MRDLVKLVSWCIGRFGPRHRSSVSVLMYHRVSGDLKLELDLPFSLFERQLVWLSETTSVISYEEALVQLSSKCDSTRLKFVLTFDDAYEDFYTKVLPLLRRLQLPATLFVPTEFIDKPQLLPISRNLPNSRDKVKPMTWAQLREVSRDPLITIGAHTHTHPEMTSLSDQKIRDEIDCSSRRLYEELGFVPSHFAYPRGIWDQRVVNVVAQYYESATIIEGRLATSHNMKLHQVYRVPVRRSDGWRWFRARAKGKLFGEERIIRMVKQILGKSTSQY